MQHIRRYDLWLCVPACLLIVIGLIMVTSASMVVSQQHFQQSFHYLVRQCVYLGVGMLLAASVLCVEVVVWQGLSQFLLLAALCLLLMVLLPGVGRSINGAQRWVALGPLTFQVSELAKLFAFIYLADYATRRRVALQTTFQGFVMPLGVFGILALLLLMEPDFGSTVVLLTTVLAVLFLAGAPLRQFFLLMACVGIAFAVLAWSSPYRLQRLTGFLHPWANPFDSGYQLTQSLIAFGRGGWWGVGLGASIQKMFYLPEAHTDFLFAVLAEEIGLVGVYAVMLLYILLIARIFRISWLAWFCDRAFSAYLAFALGTWLALQVFINMGVNCGLLPTKGLTLPLLSAGGSSLLVTCVALAIIMRIDYEVQLTRQGFVVP